MIVPNQKIEIKALKHSMIDYYTLKGYDIKISKPCMINAEDLQPNSSKKIKVVCDYCGKEYSMIFSNYSRIVLNSEVKKCACAKCGSKKYEEISILKHGVRNPMQMEDIKEKAKKTCVQRYGAENPMQNAEIAKKARNTCFERHGFISPFQTEECQKKIIEIRMEKYGVPYMFMSTEIKNKSKVKCEEKYGSSTPFESHEIREKIQQIFLNRYGGISPLGSEDVLSKISNTRFKNNTCISSKEQRRLSELFNAEINYPVGRYNVDLLLEDNIILEYDGGAHDREVKSGRITVNEFKKKEKLRIEYIINKGYKVIRFSNTNDLLITDENYVNALQKCKNELKLNNSYVEYDFNNNQLFSK